MNYKEKEKESRSKKAHNILIATAKSFYKDLFQSLHYDASIFRGEIKETKNTFNDELENLKKETPYNDFNSMLDYYKITPKKFIQKYRITFVGCFVIIGLILYLGIVIVDTNQIMVKLVSTVLIFIMSIYYIRNRMWLLMVETRRFVKIGEWLKLMWRYPIRFFPRRPSKIFTSENSN